MKMILKNIVTEEDSLFRFVIAVERDGGGVQYCGITLEKGIETEKAAKKFEDLAKQLREA